MLISLSIWPTGSTSGTYSFAVSGNMGVVSLEPCGRTANMLVSGCNTAGRPGIGVSPCMRLCSMISPRRSTPVCILAPSTGWPVTGSIRCKPDCAFTKSVGISPTCLPIRVASAPSTRKSFGVSNGLGDIREVPGMPEPGPIGGNLDASNACPNPCSASRTTGKLGSRYNVPVPTGRDLASASNADCSSPASRCKPAAPIACTLCAISVYILGRGDIMFKPIVPTSCMTLGIMMGLNCVTMFLKWLVTLSKGLGLPFLANSYCIWSIDGCPSSPIGLPKMSYCIVMTYSFDSDAFLSFCDCFHD